jgi:AcrR family transcriptional regulator
VLDEEPERQYRPTQVRAKILAESASLFAQAGFASTSVAKIAESAGVTKGALYHHFASKEEILRVLYESYLEERTARYLELTSTTDDPYEQLALLIADTFRHATSDKSILGLFLREREVLARSTFDAARRAQRRLYDIYEDVVRRGQEIGSFRTDVNPRHAAYSIMGTLVWSEYWFDASRSSSDRIVEDTRLLLLHGLTATPSPPACAAGSRQR